MSAATEKCHAFFKRNSDSRSETQEVTKYPLIVQCIMCSDDYCKLYINVSIKQSRFANQKH